MSRVIKLENINEFECSDLFITVDDNNQVIGLQQKITKPDSLESLETLLKQQETIDNLVEEYFKKDPDNEDLIQVLRNYGKDWVYE